MQPTVDAAERFLLAVFLRRYVEWQITGPAGAHRRGGSWDSFNPFRKIVTHAELARLEEPQPDLSGARIAKAEWVHQARRWTEGEEHSSGVSEA